jgi:hypothetical protein
VLTCHASNEFHDDYARYNPGAMAPTPVKPVQTVEIPKAEPGRDDFAEHPHVDIKTQGRVVTTPDADAEPIIEIDIEDDDGGAAHVGQGQTVAHEQEVVPTVEREAEARLMSPPPPAETEIPAPAAPAQDAPKAPAPPADEAPAVAQKEAAKPAPPPVPAAEAGALAADEAAVDRVAQALYSEEGK